MRYAKCVPRSQISRLMRSVSKFFFQLSRSNMSIQHLFRHLLGLFAYHLFAYVTSSSTSSTICGLYKVPIRSPIAGNSPLSPALSFAFKSSVELEVLDFVISLCSSLVKFVYYSICENLKTPFRLLKFFSW